MKKLDLRILTIIILIAATFLFQRSIPPIYHHSEPLALFPSGPLVEITTAPLGPIASDLLWLAAIQYYGEEKITGGTFQFLFEVFETLIRIDPEFNHAYKFGAIVIADEGQEPDRAVEILKKGCVRNPDSWIPPFYIGFISYYYQNDYQKAGRYFEWASRFADAPEMAYRLAAFSYQMGESNRASMLVWKGLYENTEDPTMKEVAIRNIKYLVVAENLDLLNCKLRQFRRDKNIKPNSIDDLIPQYIEYVPEEPFGGDYRYDIQGDSFTSTSYLRLQKIISLLNSKLHEFRNRFGYYPQRLDELMARGVIKEIPPHPLGAHYRYRKDIGKVY